MKKSFFSFLFTLLLFSNSAIAHTVDGWNIDIKPIQILPFLHLEQPVETYTGDIVLHQIEQKPTDGYNYVLVPITVSRENTNSKFFSDSVELRIKDRTFKRMEDDMFLIDYKIKPFTHLNIKLGTHNGVILFEIPTDLIQNHMYLTYQQQKIELSVQQMKEEQ